MNLKIVFFLGERGISFPICMDVAENQQLNNETKLCSEKITANVKNGNCLAHKQFCDFVTIFSTQQKAGNLSLDKSKNCKMQLFKSNLRMSK